MPSNEVASCCSSAATATSTTSTWPCIPAGARSSRRPSAKAPWCEMKAGDLWLHRALRLAGEVFIADTGEEPLPREVVMRSLVDACDTIRRLPDQERGCLYSMRTLWPEVVRDRQDDHEAYEAMLARINSGEESADVLLPVR